MLQYQLEFDFDDDYPADDTPATICYCPTCGGDGFSGDIMYDDVKMCTVCRGSGIVPIEGDEDYA